MAAINRRPPFAFRLLSELAHRNKHYAHCGPALAAPPPPPRSRRVTRSWWQYLMIVYVWVAYNCSYYGFQFAIIMSENFMVCFVLLSVTEFLGSYISATVESVKYMMSAAAACCVAVGVLREGVVSTVLLLLAKLLMTFFSGILLAYTMQLFPTHYRARGFSLCTLASKAALVFMPAALSWVSRGRSLSPLLPIGGLLAVAAAVSARLLRTEEDETAEVALLEPTIG